MPITDGPSLQAAVDAASAAGGGLVLVLAGTVINLTYPIFVDGPNVTIDFTDGPTSIINLLSGSPAFVISAATRTVGSAVRPAVAGGVYDGSVSAGKHALATIGALAAISGHPLQFGCRGASNGPGDNWAGTVGFTLNFFIEQPAGAVWGDGNPLAGLGTFADVPTPNPWFLCSVPGGFAIDLMTTSGRRRLFMPANRSLTRWKGTIQYDPTSGHVDCWINGASAAATGPEAGLTMAPTDGYSPFMFGFAGMAVARPANQINPCIFYGFMPARGLLFQHGNATQTWIANPAQPVNDDNLFFSPKPDTIPDAMRVAWLPLVDTPGTLPTIRVDSPGYTSQLFWCPADTGSNYTARIGSRITIRNVTILGGMQPQIQVGRDLDLRIENVTATGASQAVGNFFIQNSYPVALDGIFDGYDAAIVMIGNIWSFRGQIPNVGRDGIRSHGAYGDVDMFAWRVGANTETVIRCRGSDDGLHLRIISLLLDNESTGGPPTRAILEIEQNGFRPGRIVVDHLAASTVASTAAMLNLIGHGLPIVYQIDAKGLDTTQLDGFAVRVSGTGFIGRIDGLLLPNGNTSGDLTGINFVRTNQDGYNAMLDGFLNLASKGTITAVTSATQFVCSFVSPVPPAASLSGLQCCNTTLARGPGKQFVLSASVVDSTHLAITLVAPGLPVLPVVTDTLLFI